MCSSRNRPISLATWPNLAGSQRRRMATRTRSTSAGVRTCNSTRISPSFLRSSMSAFPERSLGEGVPLLNYSSRFGRRGKSGAQQLLAQKADAFHAGLQHFLDVAHVDHGGLELVHALAQLGNGGIGVKQAARQFLDRRFDACLQGLEQ